MILDRAIITMANQWKVVSIIYFSGVCGDAGMRQAALSIPQEQDRQGRDGRRPCRLATASLRVDLDAASAR